VRTGRARSKIRHHLKTLAQADSEKLGEKLLLQALRGEGVERFPADDEAGSSALWSKLLHFTGNRSRAELLEDIGLGKRVADIVAKRLAILIAEGMEGAKIRPDAIRVSQEQFLRRQERQAPITVDGSESASVRYAPCCRPIPGDAIIGYLGRGEGLVVHTADCATARKLLNKDSDRFIGVEWSDEPTRAFQTAIIVTLNNGKGVLARVASALAGAEADIVHIDMGQEGPQEVTDLRFIIAVRDRVHLAAALRALKRTPAVLRARRAVSS
jgi:GTP pyrophosphokinase